MRELFWLQISQHLRDLDLPQPLVISGAHIHSPQLCFLLPHHKDVVPSVELRIPDFLLQGQVGLLDGHSESFLMESKVHLPSEV